MRMRKQDNNKQEREQEQERQEVEQVEPIAIYENNILALVDDVKSMEQFKGLTDAELKENKSFFPVLIDYIYNNYIGELLGNKHGKMVIYRDIQQLDYLFDIYISLIHKYKWNNKPFLIEFSTFVGIRTNTFYNWLNGLDNNNGGVVDKRSVASPERCDIVQKWLDMCERALLNGSDSSTVRDIFILKAKHGYRDNNNDVTITVNHKNILTANELPALLDLQPTESPKNQ